MALRTSLVSCWIALAYVGCGHAQVPPTAAPDQAALLKSADPKLAANKKLVFDMWRAIIQGAHTELAPKYFTEGYIQHNPNVATGRDAMVDVHEATRPVRPIEPTITFPVIAIMAEGDLVMVATVSTPPTRKRRTRSTPAHISICSGSRTARSPSTGTVWRRARAALHFDPNPRTNPESGGTAAPPLCTRPHSPRAGPSRHDARLSRIKGCAYCGERVFPAPSEANPGAVLPAQSFGPLVIMPRQKRVAALQSAQRALAG